MPSYFSRSSIFCSYASKEELWERLGYKVLDTESVSQSNFNLESEQTDSEATEEIEDVESDEPTIDDILDLLPLDPFDKGKKSTAFAAVADLYKEIEGVFELSSDCPPLMDESQEKIGDGGVFARLNWVYWNSAVLFQPQGCFAKSMPYNEVDGGGDEPHEAIAFALPYLDLKDLLSVERVCRSLRDEVRSNTLLWRSISIVSPLSEKMDDKALLNLTSKAQGTLESLTLIGCRKIHNDALKCVLNNNPKLKELCVPGCNRISVDDMLSNLRDMKSAGKLGIKILRLADLWGGTLPKLAELKCLLSVEDNRNQHKPKFYNWVKPYILSDDDRALDIETCPKCSEVSLVYDCPLKSCREKCEAAQSCRGCIGCIHRCSVCGCCSEDDEFYEEVYYNFFCQDCYEEFYEVKQPVEKIISSTCTVFICG